MLGRCRGLGFGAAGDLRVTMAEPISSDLLELLRQRVGSLEELEVLLLLQRTRERRWAIFEIARELGLPDSIVDTTLVTLRSQNFVAAEGPGDAEWNYQPRTAELAALVERLAAVYVERRLEVMRVLSARALERVRDSAARAFADAFIIRRKKDG
jgi:DNA-binding IclR family transcriptional regulator